MSEDRMWDVPSAADKAYLAEILYDSHQIDVTELLRVKYDRGKLNFERMDPRLGVGQLEVDELAKALEAFERFDASSWEQIQGDTYFYYNLNFASELH